eukprot:9083142-Alexandrium_andersonii.AAC.1
MPDAAACSRHMRRRAPKTSACALRHLSPRARGSGGSFGKPYAQGKQLPNRQPGMSGLELR